MKDFEKIYGQAVRIAAAVSTESPTLRTAGKQKKSREDTPLESIQEYYLRNVAIPFLDHIDSEEKFSALSVKV